MIMSKAEGVAPPPSAALFAVWEHLERKCKAANSGASAPRCLRARAGMLDSARYDTPPLPPAAFMRCKKEKRDPSLCLAEGQAVMDCSYSLISDLHRKAPAEFDEYAYVSSGCRVCQGQARGPALPTR